MKTLILVITAALAMGACNSEASPETNDEITTENQTIDTIMEIPEPPALQIGEWDGEYESYNGNYFSIQYPSNFVAKPLEPIDQFDDFEFIQTDEAIFTSPEGAVEFFVYSPLWGGEPESYLNCKENEEITESSESSDTDESGFEMHYKWVTFTDKDGAYTRSYASIKTESTDLVFGIKSINNEAYEAYKESYLKFKESLEQFADA